MHLHQMAHNRQPQTETAMPARRVSFELAEAVEYEGEKLRLDPLASVAHGDCNARGLAFKADLDLPSSGGELDGVGQEIPDDLLAMIPFKSLLIMASSDDSTIAAIRASTFSSLARFAFELDSLRDRREIFFFVAIARAWEAVFCSFLLTRFFMSSSLCGANQFLRRQQAMTLAAFLNHFRFIV
jgi:hypothetical protein